MLLSFKKYFRSSFLSFRTSVFKLRTSVFKFKGYSFLGEEKRFSVLGQVFLKLRTSVFKL